MKLNTAKHYFDVTHEGGKASSHLTAEQQLRRSVMSCLLFENEFYEDGKTIAERISEYAVKVSPEVLAAIAIEARKQFNLRHVPLLLLDTLSKTGPHLMAETTYQVISRADEMAELLAVYWRNGRKAVPRQMRIGIARALTKFSEYQLAKYDRDGAIKLRDVLRIARPKPVNAEQANLWAKVVKRELQTPDTWEVALSGGADKKETFERLLKEGKLGYLALLRNLRNMATANVDADLVKDAIVARKNGADKVLPFRYVAACRAAPQFAMALDQAMQAAISEVERLSGNTVMLVDVSGSMDTKLSAKADLTRIDAAAALSSLANGNLRVFTFSHALVEVPPYRGLAGIDAIAKSQPHSGTLLGQAVDAINQNIKYDRLIVITDEQSADVVPAPTGKGYMINVASYKNGVGYGQWTKLDGFSERIFKFIQEIEKA